MTRPKDFPPLWFGASDVQQAAHKLMHLMSGEILRLDITSSTYQVILATYEMLIEGLQPLQPIFRP
ncbi:hypothetical protein FJ492_01780 [Mesorhizobium sp. B2-5-4]|uniref:hypothetical protein n=1 Tax=Mesorhizobium sp. B2-5-4 TaxID=2589926 RepID=UPI001128364E|nr:hypothetical protein [Mesorhizobium sp. B2-5-4]TPK49834.1 hypothetical protein FJ492_01780 [Mesorhizobium sp. B2-5-4]